MSLQLGTAHLDHIVKFLGLDLQSLIQTVQLMESTGQQSQDGQLAGGGIHIVGGLSHVHMIIGMDDGIIALLAAQDLDGPVGNDLVGVHIGRGAGAALDGVDDELVMELAVDDFVAGGDDGVGDLGIQSAGMLVGHGRGLLDLSQADDQQLMHGMAGDGEVLMAAQGLDAIVSVNRHFQGTDGIGFDSCVHKKDPHFIHWPPERLFFSGTRIHDLPHGVKGGEENTEEIEKISPWASLCKAKQK